MENLNWFALRAFWNKTQSLIDQINKAGFKTYYAIRTIDSMEGGNLEYKQEPLMPGLLFVQCTMDWLQDFKQKHINQFMIYTDAATGKPAPIRDSEMDVVIMVSSAQNNDGQQVIEVLEPKPQYAKGDLVRVTQGLYKGATGIVKRIKKDRKLLVSINGVAVVAISHIPMCYLEKVEG